MCGTRQILKQHEPPPYNADKGWSVYALSNDEAEKALWKFVKEQKLGLFY